nr:hypothetical protein [uncultured Methanosphaera sp.]
MRKFIWIFTLICLVSLSCLYAADNNITNESITNGNNDNIVVNSFDELCDSVNDVKGNTQVHRSYKLDSGCYNISNSTINCSGGVNYSFDGNGQNITGTGNNSRFLYVDENSCVNISGINLVNSTSRGGLIINYGSLCICNSSFINNSAIVEDSYADGFIVEGCGGVIINYGNVTIINCNFTDNTAASSGGVLYNHYDSHATITNSYFTSNMAYGDGGVCSNYGTLNVSNSSFRSNCACVYDDPVDIYAGYGGVFSSYDTLDINSCNFSDNSAAYCGGSIYNSYGSLIVNNSNIISSHAEDGGAIYNEDVFEIYNSIIENSNAYYYRYYNGFGGAIYNNYGFITSSNTIYIQCSALCGGVVYNRNGHLDINGCSFSSNIAYEYNSSDVISDLGGVIFNNDATCNITTSNFTDNNATLGAILYSIYSSSIISIDNSNITDNTNTPFYIEECGEFNLTNTTIKYTIITNQTDITLTAPIIINDSYMTYYRGESTDNTTCVLFNIANDTITTYYTPDMMAKCNYTFTQHGHIPVDIKYAGYEHNNNTITIDVYIKPNTKLGTNTTEGPAIYTVDVNTPQYMDILDVETIHNTDQGYVIYKIGGCTLKDENGNTIKTKPTNTIAQLKYKLPENLKPGKYTLNIIHILSDNKRHTKNIEFNITKAQIKDDMDNNITIKHQQNLTLNYTLHDTNNNQITGTTKIVIKINNKTITQTNTTLNIQLRNATITINTQTSVYSKQPLDVNITIVEDMKPVNGGYVIFKINGCTIKDANGKTIKYAVVNGCVNAQLNTTKKVGAGNITVIYSNDKLYNKTTTTENITVNKTPIIIPEIPEITIKRGENMTLNFTIYDIYNNTIDGNTKVTIKINGKTQLDKAKVNGGVVNLSVNTQDMTTGIYKVEVIIQNSQYETIKTNTTLHITLKTAIVTIDVKPTEVYTKDPVDINITVFDGVEPVSDGQIILKINGNTLKDNDGNTIKYNLTDGCLNTTLDVIKPAGNVNITANIYK